MAMNLSDQDNASAKMLGNDLEAPARGGETMNAKGEKVDWLKIARQALDQSKNYYETHLRKEWKASLAHFRSEHAAGSKYNKVEFAKRSRAFRPKTRSMVLRKEASAAGAFFASEDVCTISPVDPDNDRSRAGAEVTNAILNHRLKVSIPWFLISQGNYQTALNQGICCSKQYWECEATFQTVHVAEPVMNEMGQPTLDEQGQPKINITQRQQHTGYKIDQPVVLPVSPENLLFHPNADWLRPVESSPYLIYRFPMFAIDVKAKSKDIDPKSGQPQWKTVSDQQLTNAARLYAETLDVRDDAKRRESEQTAGGELKDFDTVWVFEYFIRRDGVDNVFYTLGREAMLTDPKPIEEIYLQGERPFVVGIASLEAFTPYPQSKVQQLAPTQRQANEIMNQRMDNVKLAMNGRYWVREGKKVDLAVLSNSTPGSSVLMSDPQTDVKWDRPADVTGSAYQEQDRLNVDFDDLAGIMSNGTVQSDRKLNETVGGMNIMSSDASAVQEYELRIFAISYVEPVLRQIVKLIQKYETDITILGLGGKQAQSMEKYGIDPTMDDLMNESLLVSVSVGVGATAPAQRMNKLQQALTAFWNFVNPLINVFGPQVIESPGVKRVGAEIFGAAGYKDVDPFLDFGPPAPPPGQQPPQGQPGVDPQVAAQAMQVEQQEKDADRANATLRDKMKDQGQTTRTIIQAHKDLIIANIKKGGSAPGSNVIALRPGGVPPIPPQQPSGAFSA